MGLLQKLRERVADAALGVGFVIAFVRCFPKFCIEEWKMVKLYRSLTPGAAAALDDAALWECLHRRIKEMETKDWEEQFPEWNIPRRTLFTLWQFEGETMNGGLCQYFVNSSRATAPYLEDALKEVGAEQILKLFHEFVTENGIDLTNLDSFDIEDASEFEAQNQRYPFDEFDDAFYELYEVEEMDDTMKAMELAYAREHLNAIF